MPVIGFPSSIAAFRERTNAMPPIVLRPKRCACGKATTAKQLTQHGKCVACARIKAAS